jgi:hypothetical protein
VSEPRYLRTEYHAEISKSRRIRESLVEEHKHPRQSNTPRFSLRQLLPQKNDKAAALFGNSESPNRSTKPPAAP